MFSSRVIAGNNGLIQCIQDATGTQQAGRSVSYSYDALNRVSTAVTTGSTSYPQWGLSWSYDRFGNRLGQTVSSGAGYAVSSPVDSTTNRVMSYSYDAAGNVAGNGVPLVYDAENRLTSYSGGTGSYSYDANGVRVAKVSNGMRTVYDGSTPICELVGASLAEG